MRQCSLNLSRVFQVACRQERAYTGLAHRIKPSRKDPEPLPISLSPARPNPFVLVAPELTQIRGRLLHLIGSAHPGFHDAAEYFLLRPSVQLRSLLVLLFSRVANGLDQDWGQQVQEASPECLPGSEGAIKNALENPGILYNWHPTMPDTAGSFSSVFELQRPIPREQGFPTQLFSPVASPSMPTILPTQMHLAQVMEMIHIAFLLHDGVYDGGQPRVEPGTKVPSNKLTILGGDFLLGRASAVLPLLGENDVVELIAGIISNAVEGEMLRMDGVRTPKLGLVHGPRSISEAWDQYLKKTYLKDASLMAKGARAAVLLNGSKVNDLVKDVAYLYGRNLGFAKQLMDDANDYELGPSNVQPGIATAPALYATEEYPDIFPIMARRLSQDGDVECVIDCVRMSSGVERTRSLARTYGDKAKEALRLLPDSDTVGALEVLVEEIVG